MLKNYNNSKIRKTRFDDILLSKNNLYFWDKLTYSLEYSYENLREYAIENSNINFSIVSQI